jgi:hypothetical protein
VSDRESGLPLEQFIQALTSQLDRAQNTMALKARAGLPLTFAVKDLTLNLRTHVEMIDSVVRIRPAGPGEGDASMLHISLTTITRPMIEENTFAPAVTSDEPSLKEVVGKDMTDAEQRRLEWAGIHTVSQLRDMQRHGGEQAVERAVDIPVLRLRAALARASQPLMTNVMELAVRSDDPELAGATMLRIQGHNLVLDGDPQVHINGEAVPVVRAHPKEIVVSVQPHQYAGTVTVETGPGASDEKDFRLAKAARPARDKVTS